MARRSVANLIWLAVCLLTAVGVTMTVGFVAPYAVMYALIALGGTTLIWLRD